jgi:pimeloyl-ACP methyl ester carboxylesterase
MGLWTDMRGAGDPLVVFLDGLNATAAVWEPLDAVMATSWPGRRLLIDLPGHGRSDPLPEYSFGIVAAAVATAIGHTTAPVVVVGHSMGAVVALTLASGWFGFPVAEVLAIGVKFEWSPDELEAMARSRERPVKWYASREEAEQRFVQLAGIPPDASHPDLLAGGVRTVDGRFRVAADPRARSIGGPAVESLIAAATAPVRLVCGERDSRVSVDQLRRFDPDAVAIADAGHNAHIERPSAVADLIAAGQVLTLSEAQECIRQ